MRRAFNEGDATVSDKRVLLIVGGGIAAYKALELTRLLRKAGVAVRPILTAAGAQFVTPLSLSALAEDKVYTDLFSPRPTRPRWATSSCRARPTWWWSRRPPPT